MQRKVQSMTESRLRPPTMADAEHVSELMNLRAETLGSPTRSETEAIVSWWETSCVDLAADMVMAGNPGERLDGFAAVERTVEPYVAIFGGAIVHPDLFDCGVLWDRLHEWIVARARDFLPLAPSGAQVSLFTEAIEQDVSKKAAVARAGFSLARIFYRMRMDLGRELSVATIPAGIEVRKMRPDELPRVAEVHVDVFRDHWGHGDKSPEEFANEWIEETAGQSSGFSHVAVTDGKIVGYALCEDRYRGDTAIGHISTLGVRRPYRGRGIATALLSNVLSTFQEAKCTAARLGVDGDSPTGATRLYEKAGMAVIEQVNRYELVLRPGKDTLTRGGDN